jgi:glycerol-1-phosphate dehydrogenase [NAD(P)+]
MLTMEHPDAARAEAAMASFSPEAWEKQMREIFGPIAPTVLAIEAQTGKNLPENHRQRLDAILAHWPEIQQIIRQELPPRDQVYALMQRCHMPLTPADLGLGWEDTRDALLGSREIRDKYLTSSLLWDLGLLEETADKLRDALQAEG